MADRRRTAPYVPACILWDFPGENEGELPCNAGDIVTVIMLGDDGWVTAERAGQVGLVPEKYLKELETKQDKGGPPEPPKKPKNLFPGETLSVSSSGVPVAAPLKPIGEYVVTIVDTCLAVKGGEKKAYTAYVVEIDSATCRWHVYRRYAHFDALHQMLKKKVAGLPKLPAKTLFHANSTKSDLVEQRRTSLQEYVRTVLKMPNVVSMPVFQSFLELKNVFVAAYQGELKDLKQAVSEMKTDVNEQDLNGRTPLHYAAMCGHSDLVDFLLKSGAQNIPDEMGITPLSLAQRFEQKEIVRKIKTNDSGMSSDLQMIELLERKIADLKDSNEDLQEQMKKVVDQCEIEGDDVKAAHQKKLQEYSASLEEEKARFQRSHDEAVALRDAELCRLQDRILAIEKELGDARGKEHLFDSVNEECVRLRMKIEGFESEMDRVAGEKREYLQQVAMLTGQRDAISVENKKLAESLAQQSLNASQSAVGRITQLLAEKEVIEAKYESYHNVADKEIESMRIEKQRLLDENVKLSSDLASTQRDLAELRKRLANYAPPAPASLVLKAIAKPPAMEKPALVKSAADSKNPSGKPPSPVSDGQGVPSAKPSPAPSGDVKPLSISQQQVAKVSRVPAPPTRPPPTRSTTPPNCSGK